METNLTADTLITLHPLAIHFEDEQYLVGRVETSQFVTLPPIGGRVIEFLQRGCSLGEAQALLAKEFDAEVDLGDFVSNLLEMGFVQAIDGHAIPSENAVAPNLAWLRPEHVRWLFSWPAQGAYFLLLLAAALTLVLRPHLLPTYRDFFWAPTISLLIVANTALTITNGLIHELAHLAAARSLGMPTRITLGTRLNNLVIQSDVSGIWAAPRRQRYRVYLAGMQWDLLPMAIAILLVAYAGLPPLAENLLQAIVVLNFISIVTQFHLYMRTDIYFVALDLLHCHNLFEDALAYLHYQKQRILGRLRLSKNWVANPLESIPSNEHRKIKIYAWFTLAGSGLALLVFAGYGLPILVNLFIQAGISMWAGATQGDVWRFLDGASAALIEGGYQVLFLNTFFKTHKRQG